MNLFINPASQDEYYVLGRNDYDSIVEICENYACQEESDLESSEDEPEESEGEDEEDEEQPIILNRRERKTRGGRYYASVMEHLIS